MTFKEFVTAAEGFSSAELRCEVSPRLEILDLMDDVGDHDTYERYVLRLLSQRQQHKAGKVRIVGWQS
jgi:hypothetical protein